MTDDTREQPNPNEGRALIVFFAPVFLLAAGISLIGWFSALAGARYRTVKYLSIPLGLVTSNAAGALLCLAGLFTAAMVTDNGHLFSLQTIGDLSLMFVWGPFLELVWLGSVQGTFVPRAASPFFISVYQLVLWLTLGRMITRAVSMGLYDAAIVRRAISNRLVPSDLRLDVARSDADYASDAIYYERKGLYPLLGIVTVALAGASPATFYRGPE